jgi:D-arabinose 1-dehydrogenase-like Zn-dependent alcohol dehydrogenase
MSDTYTSYDLVEFGKPLQARQRPMPRPEGTQVLLRIRRSGVCHSDIHIQDGYFDLGEAGKLSLEARGLKLPVAMGHEMLGEVVALGPDARADGVEVGKTMLIFPWVGCGECLACQEDRENDCAAMQSYGVAQDGGYATHVLIRHPKFLVDVEGLDPDVVTPYACSGLTVFNALGRIGKLRDGEWLAIIGTGGLGLNAIAIAKAMGFERVIGVDQDAAKLEAAREMGADAVLDTSQPEAAKNLMKLAGGRLLGVLDTVGLPATSQLGIHALAKTGRYLVVGLHGGDFKMPLPMLPQKALSVCGAFVGSSPQLRELIALVRKGKVKPLIMESRPLSQASEALDDLRAGKVTGRVVLNGDQAG